MRWDRILYQRTPLNYLLYPFSLIFSALLLLRRFCYRTGVCQVYTSEVKVISVGNIVSGGSGKTPFTIYVAGLLKEAGYKAAVSHRGYKGKFEQTTRIISDEKGLRKGAEEAGDEPFLIAQKLPGIPVAVGKNRIKAITILQKTFPDLDYIILDDSFQHLRVKKDIELVLFNAAVKLGNGFVLPAGILREPLTALRYADYIVYNGKDEIPSKLKKPGKRIIRIEYRIKSFTLTNGDGISAEVLRGKRIALFSGIGQPGSFEETVAAAGIKIGKHYRFPDHFGYNNKQQMIKLEKETKELYDYVLTTEKDYTKLNNYKDIFPFVIVSIEVNSKSKDIMKILTNH
jgi:tetraacyldisaccharide 4'-kinase